jgi:cellulose synthase/poly-beta-1,6-N-acetylglucosamine synthase-like glycosyltransferase
MILELLAWMMVYGPVALLVAYLFWVVKNLLLWKRAPHIPVKDNSIDVPFISVIIPVRNEEDNILHVLKSLEMQDHPTSRFEVLVTDDFSTDQTAERVHQFMFNTTMSVRWISNSNGDAIGKKAALKRAIDASKGDIVLTTDADCLMGLHWIQSMARAFSSADINMVTGFVKSQGGSTLMSRLEQLDQLVLSSVGATSVLSGKPVLCSGANLAFRKQAFYEVGGYNYGAKDPSGDDTYLMLRMIPHVRFNKNQNSLVTTRSQSDWKTIVQQRIRWASKAKHYKEKRILAFGAFMTLLNLSPLVYLPFCFLNVEIFIAMVYWFSLKLIMDFLFVSPFARFSNQRGLLKTLPIYSLIYPIYILMALFMIPFRGYEWKGRSYPK